MLGNLRNGENSSAADFYASQSDLDSLLGID